MTDSGVESHRLSWLSSAKIAFESLRVALIVVPISFIVTWVPWRYSRWNSNYFHETGQNFTEILNQFRIDDPWTATLQDVTFDLWMFGYFPYCAYIYIEHSHPYRDLFWSILGVLIGYVPFFVCRLMWDTRSFVVRVLFVFGLATPFLVVFRYKIIRRKSIMVKGLTLVYTSFILGTFILPAYHIFARKSNEHKMIFVLVYIPFFRETITYFSRMCAKYLTMHSESNVEDSYEMSFRSNTWVFFIWAQMIAAIMQRVVVSSLAMDKAALVWVVFCQAVSEFALRLTVEKRDKLLDKVKNMLQCRMTGQKLAVVAPSINNSIIMWDVQSEEKKEYVTKGTKLARSRSQLSLAKSVSEETVSAKAFYSMIILGEMIAEQYAIFTVFFITLLFWNMKIYMPIGYYESLEDPFNSHPNIPEILFAALTQSFMELFVDTLCVFYETRQGYFIKEIWNGRSKMFIWLFVAATTFGNCLAFAFFSPGLHDYQGGTGLACDDGIIAGSLLFQYCRTLRGEDANLTIL